MRKFLLVLAVGFVSTRSIGSAAPGGHAHAGGVHFPISCRAASQNDFNEAVALLHHMTYPQARSKFEAIEKNDPQCAMAHWGVAMTLFQPLWPTRPSKAALQRGWQEVRLAKSLGLKTEREKLFVSEAEAFFTDPASTDYWQRIRRWEEASAKAHAALPNDTEIAVFYALSHLATAPANGNAKKNADESAATLTKLYEHHPDHPGVMHYLVHANDVPGRERELLAVTHKYENVAPDNPHALHMPTHIYTRLGDWDGVIRGNLRAADAALSYPAGEKGEFVWDEFAHAIEYLVYGYLQEGADDKAGAQIQRLRAVPNLEPAFKTAFHLASTQARYALERSAWTEASLIEPRTPTSIDWDKFPWPESVSVFARGLGAARTGHPQDAEESIARMQVLEEHARSAGEDLFARNIQLLRTELIAWLAHARGQDDEAVREMKEAAALEAGTPKHAVTPAPTLPASELLGDLYMETRRWNDAFIAYQSALKAYPHRLRSVQGAARAARAKGDLVVAKTYYRQVLDLAGNGSRSPDVREAQQYLATGD